MHFKVMLGAICVAEYDADEAIPAYRIDPEYVGPQYVTIDETGGTATVVTSRFIWTKFEFLRRFSPQERIAIRRAIAAGDEIAEDFMALLEMASEVDSDVPELAAGLGYLEASGLLAAGRANEILGR